MTEDNCRLNVQFEWEKADESLLEVNALLEKKLWAAAISRAYYGIFHLGRALLFASGLEARSHGGMVHLLSAHLARNNEFSTEMIRAFSRLQRLREDADYQAAMRFEEETAEEALRTFLAFREETESFLRSKGMLPR
jgi:uncharacterized protein (UPF0332 family)